MTFRKTLLITTILLLLIGCSNTPEEAVGDVYDALQEGNMVKLVNNSTDKISGALAVNALKDCKVNKKEYEDDLKLMHDCLIEKYATMKVKKIEIKILSEIEADANITIEMNSKEYTRKQKVRKIENRWRVAF